MPISSTELHPLSHSLLFCSWTLKTFWLLSFPMISSTKVSFQTLCRNKWVYWEWRATDIVWQRRTFPKVNCYPLLPAIDSKFNSFPEVPIPIRERTIPYHARKGMILKCELCWAFGKLKKNYLQCRVTGPQPAQYMPGTWYLPVLILWRRFKLFLKSSLLTFERCIDFLYKIKTFSARHEVICGRWWRSSRRWYPMSRGSLTTHRYKGPYASYARAEPLLSLHHALARARTWPPYIWAPLINDMNAECHQTQHCTCNQNTAFMRDTRHNQTLRYTSVPTNY